MSAYIKQRDLRQAVKSSGISNSRTVQKNTLKKMGVDRMDSSSRGGRSIGVVKSKKQFKKFLRQSGVSAKRKKKLVNAMFSSGTSKQDMDESVSPKSTRRVGPFGFGKKRSSSGSEESKPAGLFSRGDSASRARDQLAKQFGTGSGPGFTSDRSDGSSASPSSGGSSRGSRPSGRLY